MPKHQLLHSVLFFIFIQTNISAGWLCREASSIKEGNTLTSCGIGYGKTEALARENGLKQAFKELDSICDRSIDCKNQELLLEPLRNECIKESGQFKCYRALLATITNRKRPKQKVEVNPPIEKTDQFIQIVKDDTREKTVTKNVCEYEFPNMRDLLSQNHITKAVNTVKSIPFRLACSKIHYDFMHLLSKMNRFPKLYRNYLYSLLKTFDGDWRDYRPMAIFSYLYKGGDWSAQEWKLLYEAIRSSNQSEFSRYSSLILHKNSKNKKIQLARLSGLTTDLINKRIGFPNPLDASQSIVKIASHATKSDDIWILEEIFSKQIPRITRLKSKKIPLKQLEQLIFNKDFSLPKMLKIQSWMIEILKKESHLQEGQEFYMSYVKKIDSIIDRQDITIEEEEKVYQTYYSLKKNFLDKSSSLTNQIFSTIEKKHRKKSTILFCLNQNINCEKVIPSLETLQKRLTSSKDKTIEETTEYLTKMPNKAFLIKDQLFGLLKKKYRNSIRSNIVEALVNTPISDKEDIDTILLHSWDRVFSYDEVVKKLGKRVLISLIPIAADSTHNNQKVAIQMIGNMGNDAQSAIETLTKVIRTTNNYAIRDTATEALSRIK